MSQSVNIMYSLRVALGMFVFVFIVIVCFFLILTPCIILLFVNRHFYVN